MPRRPIRSHGRKSLPPEELMDRSKELAKKIAAILPSPSKGKKVMWEKFRNQLREAFVFESYAQESAGPPRIKRSVRLHGETAGV